MKNLGNVEQLVISDLVEEGMYSQELLKDLLLGKYEELYKLPIADRANRDFMYPLLYAVKNTNSTYVVYKYLGENLQDNTKLAAEIIEAKEPELLKGTPVSKNRDFIKEKVETYPELVTYMSPELKNDIEIIGKVYKTENEQAIKAIEPNAKMIAELTQNPALSSDKAFMIDKISQFGEAIQFASEELKNDYEFLKEAYKSNVTDKFEMTAIDYTAEHTEEFGEKGLLAAKEVVIETTTDNSIKGFTNARDAKREELNALLKEPSSEKKDEKIKQLQMDEKRFQRHVRFIERIKSGEIDPVRAAKAISRYCAKLEPEYRKRLEQILIIDTAMKQKQQEETKQVTEEDIGEVARNFGEMEGKLPQGEKGELKSAIEEPVIESENPIENDAPEQK